MGAGRIVTRARWRTEAYFFDACARAVGTAVSSTDGIDVVAAKKTFGLIRPDDHAHDLFAFRESKR